MMAANTTLRWRESLIEYSFNRTRKYKSLPINNAWFTKIVVHLIIGAELGDIADRASLYTKCVILFHAT